MTTLILDLSRPAVRRALVFGVALCALLVAALAPSVAAAATFNPLYIISDDNWRASGSMSQADIQAFLEAQGGVLKSYSCAEGGPNGAHGGAVKPASLIIWEAAQYWGVNPKLVLATLEKEQSLISAPYHVASASHTYGTAYHLTNAMGCGVYSGSPDRHPGFGDQVWTGTQKLGQTTGYYAWYPGKTINVHSYPDGGVHINIAPANQPTWNLYTYTPYYPQINVWTIYNKFFGDPLESPTVRPVYRFYNKRIGSHFYTASEGERWIVASRYGATYQFEGTAYSINTNNTANCVPLYRFYNVRNGAHFFTANAEEKDHVIKTWPTIFHFEGVAYNVSMTPEGGTPVYRFYNVQSSSHFYTASAAERDHVIRTWPRIYNYEGVVFYIAP